MRGLITEKKAKKVRLLRKVKIVTDKVIKILKIAFVIYLIYQLNIASNKITHYLMELNFETIKTTVFGILTILILGTYLKVCEEIKGE